MCSESESRHCAAPPPSQQSPPVSPTHLRTAHAIAQQWCIADQPKPDCSSAPHRNLPLPDPAAHRAAARAAARRADVGCPQLPRAELSCPGRAAADRADAGRAELPPAELMPAELSCRRPSCTNTRIGDTCCAKISASRRSMATVSSMLADRAVSSCCRLCSTCTCRTNAWMGQQLDRVTDQMSVIEAMTLRKQRLSTAVMCRCFESRIGVVCCGWGHCPWPRQHALWITRQQVVDTGATAGSHSLASGPNDATQPCLGSQ